MEAHYVRKETNIQLFEPELTLPKMCEMYEAECKDKDRQHVKMEKDIDIFNKNFSLSFNIPKRDQCNTCNV